MARVKMTAKEKKDNKEFFEALRLMAAERGIPEEFIAEKIADAIVVAARKDYGGSDIVTCIIDPENEVFSVVARKQIVDEVEDPFTQISREDATAYDPKSVKEDYIDIKIDPKKFGRVVAQNSKNNFRQGVREAEKGQVLAEFQSHNRELVTALVERIDPKTGKTRYLQISNGAATTTSEAEATSVAQVFVVYRKRDYVPIKADNKTYWDTFKSGYSFYSTIDDSPINYSIKPDLLVGCYMQATGPDDNSITAE